MLDQAKGIELNRCSGFYRSAPWGNEDQDDFINAVAVLDTILQPGALLNVLLDAEQQMGRERSADRWGPRCIDLDLLTYEDLRLESPGLQLPHPRMQLRAFVLQPILELDPDFVIPGVGPAKTCLSELEPQHVEYIGSAEENLAGARAE
jgi:2-amino-4-hydroxy-6-hydroxymethyldihydropteridine diphosphokinase